MAASQPQLIAPASTGDRGPPVLDSTPPTYVVDARGRRGILPSAPGRPPAPAAGTLAAKNTVIPVRDADGRFPCPYCTNTYLHTKHLKRHLLRHTGERPHKCILCDDTFYRSDVLKQHYQNCSARRATSPPQLSSSMVRVDSPANGDRRGSRSNRVVVNSTNGQNMHGYDAPPVQSGMPMYGAENYAPWSGPGWAQMFPPAGP
ncbi:hypothetical protein MY1884_005497 [Beauveria asiatica]